MSPSLLLFTLTIFFLGMCANAQTLENTLMQSVKNDTDNEESWISEISYAETNSLKLVNNLVYRLDLVPCSIKIPPKNHKVCYQTLVYYSYYRRRLACWNRRRGPYQTIGKKTNKNMFAIMPQTYKNGNYRRRIIEYFNIVCPSGTEGVLQPDTYTKIQERVKIGDREICLDYVRLGFPASNSFLEFCGNKKITIPNFKGQMLVTFRSGPNQEYKKGFYMCVVCTDLLLSNQMGCLSTNEIVSVEQYLSERTMPNYGDSEEIYVNELKEYIPQGAKEHLLKFYHDYHVGALANSNSHMDIIKLALVTQKSCDSLNIAIAQGVLELFPKIMVDQAIYEWF